MGAAFYKFFTQDFTVQPVVQVMSQSNKLSFGNIFRTCDGWQDEVFR